jgi:hypothetical protein
VEHEPHDQYHQISDNEFNDLTSFGTEAIIYFSVSACAASIAAGLWFSIDTGSAGGSTFVGKFLLNAGIPFFATFGVFTAALGKHALDRHRAALRDIKNRSAEAPQSVVRKDGMDADLTSPDAWS